MTIAPSATTTGQVRNARLRCAADHRHQPSRRGPDAAHRRQPGLAQCAAHADRRRRRPDGPGALGQADHRGRAPARHLDREPAGRGQSPALAPRLRRVVGGPGRAPAVGADGRHRGAGGQGRHRLGAPGHGAPHSERGRGPVAAARRGHAPGGPLLLPV